MFKVFIISVLTLQFSFEQDADNIGKTYYFRMGKNNNEFKVNNRIYFINHNISDYDYTYNYKPVKNIKMQADNERIITDNNDNKITFLDEEWNLDKKNITRTSDLPMFIHKLYESQTKDDYSPTESTTRILFNTNRNSSSSIIMFNLNSLKSDEVVADAELYFFWPLQNSSRIYRESVVLRLHQFERQFNGVLNESNLIENPDIHKLFNVIYISKAQRGWQTFKIKKPIDNWLNGEDNLGLLLTISSYDDNKLISVFNDTNEGIYSTFAIVTVQNNDTVQDRRDIMKNYGIHSHSPYCQKKEWNVNFKKVHWDNFIIAPQGFMAYDCVGKCVKPLNDQVNHAKFLHIFNKRSACCVPVDYLPLRIMFFDKFENVIIKKYENMIATECGCR